MTTNEVNESTPGTAADTTISSTRPPAHAPAMASLAQWEDRGKGPSAPTIISVAFSVGAIALGVLLVKNGVLAPRTLAELNDGTVRRSWAPFFDVCAVGTASVNAAETPTSLAATPSPPATPEPVRATTDSSAADARPASPARKPTDDPFAHLEEGAAPATAAPLAAAPAIASAPRIHSGKNAVASAPRIHSGKNAVAAPSQPPETLPPPAVAPDDGVPPSNHGKSTWGGERTPTP